MAIAAGDFENDGRLDLAVADDGLGRRHHPVQSGRREFPGPAITSICPGGARWADRPIAGRQLRHRQLDLAVTDQARQRG